MQTNSTLKAGRPIRLWNRISLAKKLKGFFWGMLSMALIQCPLAVFGLPPEGFSVKLAWRPSPSAEVTGYRISYGVAPGVYTNSIAVGNVTTNTVKGLSGGVTYYFAVAAYTAAGLDSVFSNEIVHTPGVAVLALRVTATRQAVLTVRGLVGHTYEIQATQNPPAWSVIGTVILGANGVIDFLDPTPTTFAKRLYRVQDKTP